MEQKRDIIYVGYDIWKSQKKILEYMLQRSVSQITVIQMPANIEYSLFAGFSKIRQWPVGDPVDWPFHSNKSIIFHLGFRINPWLWLKDGNGDIPQISLHGWCPLVV